MENPIFKVDPKNHTLLIVDDEEELRDILALQFQRDGFKVLKAANGKDAFQIVKEQNVDLIISDIRMPGGNGVELLENVRRNHHEVPVVLFITGFSDISVEEAFDKGVEAVFAKPFDRKALLKTVLQALTPKDKKWRTRQWRGPTALPVDLSLPGFEQAKFAKVMNLGRGGIFVAMDQDIPRVNERVSFKIYFSEGALVSIEGHGIVRWTRTSKGEHPPGCGIEFVDLDENSRSKIIELINYIKTKQYIPKS